MDRCLRSCVRLKAEMERSSHLSCEPLFPFLKLTLDLPILPDDPKRKSTEKNLKQNPKMPEQLAQMRQDIS